MNNQRVLLGLLKCLKEASINDPNVDLFWGVLTGDKGIVESAIARKADVSTRDRALIAKYRDILVARCPDTLNQWEST